MNEKTCEKCNEPWRGHDEPFSNTPRSCEKARIMRNAPDPYFCYMPKECSLAQRCIGQARYGRACND